MTPTTQPRACVYQPPCQNDTGSRIVKAPPQKNSPPVEEHGTPQLAGFPFSDSPFSEKVFSRQNEYPGAFVLSLQSWALFEVFSRDF